MKPSLEGAYARIRRAGGHIDELKKREPTVSGTQSDWTPEAWGSLTMRDEDVPDPIISVLIGEAVYNLRAALDYLVYELAFLDTGSIKDGTQFPIDYSPLRFLDRK